VVPWRLFTIHAQLEIDRNQSLLLDREGIYLNYGDSGWQTDGFHNYVRLLQPAIPQCDFLYYIHR